MTDNILPFAAEEISQNAAMFVRRWIQPARPLLGSSPAIELVRAAIRKVARTDATVFIHGETGTGKGLIARQVVEQSARAAAPFIELDCTALTEEQLELFFQVNNTPARGTTPDKPGGCVDLAQGGTLLLREISVLPLNCQERLMQFLESPAGPSEGATENPVPVRLLATTNRSLESKVRNREFREDLFYALNVMPIQAPSLRERADDIPELAEYFRQALARTHGVEVLAISPASLDALRKYTWPGNVQELEDVIGHAMLVCRKGVLEPEHLNVVFESSSSLSKIVQPEFITSLAETEKRHIFAVLERCKGNRTHAAAKLEISIRTLRNKLREYRQQAEAANPPGAAAA